MVRRIIISEVQETITVDMEITIQTNTEMEEIQMPETTSPEDNILLIEVINPISMDVDQTLQLVETRTIGDIILEIHKTKITDPGGTPMPEKTSWTEDTLIPDPSNQICIEPEVIQTPGNSTQTTQPTP